MPRRLFSGRSHTDPTTDQISKPVLVHTDALPRSDLQTLGRVTTSAGTRAETQTPVNEWDQIPPSFNDRGYGSCPPSSSGSMASYPDPHTIGVAVGSPSVYANPPRFETPTPRPGTSNSSVQQEGSPPKRKTSRWRKIGGLFKAKSAIEKPTPAPFYQVRLNDQELQQQRQREQRSSPETLSAPPVAQPPWANGYPKGHNYREIYPEIEDDNKYQEVKVDRKPNGYAQKSTEPSNQYQYAPGEAPWDFLIDEEKKDNRSAEGKVEPLLDVDIPDVHMERYSVMFGGLLGGKGNRSTLLARRSRHLDKLKTQDEKRVEPGEGQTLKPPTRRATSPGPAKSPSFTLFPTAPKASKSPAPQNAPSRPHHLHPVQKSHTAPIRPSSRNHESQPSSSSSQFAFTPHTPRPLTPSNVWAAERNTYLSPIVSEAPSTSSGGSVKAVTKPSPSPLQGKKQEDKGEEKVEEKVEEKAEKKPAQGSRQKKHDEKPIRAEEAMAQLEESTRQLKILAKSKDKKDNHAHRPATADGRGQAHPTLTSAMNSQTISIRENPPSRAPPHPPPNVAVPAVPRERAQTAPSGSGRLKTQNLTQFPPRTSSAAAPKAMTPPRTITVSPPPLSPAPEAEDLLSHSDHNDSDVQVHVARSISVTKTSNAQKVRRQQQQQEQQQQQDNHHQKHKQQKRQQKQQEEQHCEQQKLPRHMLFPLGGKTKPFRGDERLVERYHSPQTPTLVENLSPEQSSESGSSPFRRSQNVLIETA